VCGAVEGVKHEKTIRIGDNEDIYWAKTGASNGEAWILLGEYITHLGLNHHEARLSAD
jgi:hypothetical protein